MIRVRLRWISIIFRIRGQRLVLTLVRIRVILLVARLMIREILLIRGQRLVLTLVRIREILLVARLMIRVRLRWISIIFRIRGQRLVLTLVRIREILLIRYNPKGSKSFAIPS